VRPGPLYEAPLAPQRAPPLGPGQHLAVRIAHSTHFVERLYAHTAVRQGTPYGTEPYDALRRLPAPDAGHRSLFDAAGIVPGSKRAERWLLWPMGVPAAGAMRQWGHHAVAFIGRRHFDDPDLLNKLFEPAPPSGQGAAP
jgi:hypothetical protein